jgi:hypothetical protein
MFVANCTLAQGSVGRIPALPGKRSICGVSCRRRPWALTHSTRLELDPRLIVGAPGQLVPRADGLGERTAGSGSNGGCPRRLPKQLATRITKWVYDASTGPAARIPAEAPRHADAPSGTRGIEAKANRVLFRRASFLFALR